MVGHSRRDAFKIGTVTAGLALIPSSLAAEDRTKMAARCGNLAPSWGAGQEGERLADLGNGHYRNPVLSGDRPDPNILKDGDDYYATFSSFYYYPGVVIWHSRDLVNWRPIGPALTKPLGSVWALDIAKHGGRYFIYIPVFNPDQPGFTKADFPAKTFVIHADSMAGPWSEPVDMEIDGYIDPGHAVGADGKRYLFLNSGARVKISDDGLRRDGPVEHVYDGWPIPEEWVIEAIALEGPKVLHHNGYYYLFCGQGGTAGPPTSHMVTVARSRSIDGPWVNCPHNPIIRTAHRDEPWWSRGHATPVQGPTGDWWFVYHAYENGFRTLGRQMVLEPFVWDKDGWPKATGSDLSRSLPMPKGGHAVSTPALSGPFRERDLGSRLAFFAPSDGYLDRGQFSNGRLSLLAQGDGPATSSPLAFIAGDRSYEIEVDLELHDNCQGGLLLFYDKELFCGLGAEETILRTYKGGQVQSYPPAGPAAGRKLSLRLINDENVVTFFVRPAGKPWRQVVSWEVSGYNHNMADGFMSLRPALFASGSGKTTFEKLTYRAR